MHASILRLTHTHTSHLIVMFCDFLSIDVSCNCHMDLGGKPEWEESVVFTTNNM